VTSQFFYAKIITMKPEKKETKIVALKLVIELVVVFLGVYLAFYMDNYRENMEKEERRIQISKALYEEIEYCLKGAERNLPLMASALQEWRNRYEAGKKPVPFSFSADSIDLPPKSMWDATLASGGLNILEIETLKTLSHYYNGLNELLNRLKEHQQFARDNIAPYLDNPGHFYAPGSNELKWEYKLHIKRIDKLIKHTKPLLKLGKKAAALLKANLPVPSNQTP
jgi:hypothetical protein